MEFFVIARICVSRFVAIYFLDFWICKCGQVAITMRTSFILLAYNDESTHPLNPLRKGGGNYFFAMTAHRFVIVRFCDSANRGNLFFLDL